jgi:hypothetical protein
MEHLLKFWPNGLISALPGGTGVRWGQNRVDFARFDVLEQV